MSLLSICIPTYNRPGHLKELSRTFLGPAIDAFADSIEVIVCDNSDIDRAKQCERNLDSRIKYFRNGENLGFAGNLLRCVEQATGAFLWIISDDDPILWEGFLELMHSLSRHEMSDVGCIMLPFQTTNLHGDTVVSNTQERWGLGDRPRIRELVAGGDVPFVLFSSAVIRPNKANCASLQRMYGNNDYLQVILYLSLLDKDEYVFFTKLPVVDYQPEYRGRFTIRSLMSSMCQVREFIEREYGVPADNKKDYRGWLLWLLHHRGGLYRIKDGDCDRWHVLSKFAHNISFKNIVLAAAIIVPSSMMRFVYIGYQTFKDSKSLSPSQFICNFRRSRRFIQANLSGTNESSH